MRRIMRPPPREEGRIINGCYSEWTDVISGIPQGTILGPVLFIIYINDLPEICEEFARKYLFADDAKLFKHVTCNEDHI